MGAAGPVPGLLFFNIFINYQGDGMGSMLLNFQVRGSLEGLRSSWMTHPEFKMILRNKKKYLWHSTKRCALFLTLSRNNQLLNSFWNPLKNKIKWISGLWVTSWRWAIEKASTLLEEFSRTTVCKLCLVTFHCSALIRSQVDHYGTFVPYVYQPMKGQRKVRMTKSLEKTVHKDRTTWGFSFEHEPTFLWIDPEALDLNRSKADSCWMLKSSLMGKIKYWNRLPGELQSSSLDIFKAVRQTL